MWIQATTQGQVHLEDALHNLSGTNIGSSDNVCVPVDVFTGRLQHQVKSKSDRPEQQIVEPWSGRAREAIYRHVATPHLHHIPAQNWGSKRVVAYCK